MKIEIPDDVRGLVFDLDGTIADTMPLHYKAWVSVLGEHGAEFPEAIFYELAGTPTDRIVEILNDRHGHSMDPKRVAHEKEMRFEAMIPMIQPIEPVVQIIEQYTGKLPMAIATGGTRYIATKTLIAMNLIDRFPNAITTADDVANGKPAPDVFLEAARRIDVDPALCLAFEDGDLGIQSALAAGMRVIDVRR